MIELFLAWIFQNQARFFFYTTAFLAFALVVVLLGMGKEGRHFLMMRGKKDRISLVRLGPAGLTLRSLKWNGQFFEDGKEGIFHNIKLLTGIDYEEDSGKEAENLPNYNTPSLDPNKPMLSMARQFLGNKKGKKTKTGMEKYNEVLSQASAWTYSKIPVLMGAENVCFISNPNLFAHLRTAKMGDNTEAKGMVDRLSKVLKGHVVTKATFIEPFSAGELSEYLEASTSADERRSYEVGKVTGRLESLKPKVPGDLKSLALPILLLIILFIAWQTGALDQLLNIGSQTPQ